MALLTCIAPHRRELYKDKDFVLNPAILHTIAVPSKHRLYRLDLEVERYQRENETLLMKVSDVQISDEREQCDRIIEYPTKAKQNDNMRETKVCQRMRNK